MEKTTEERLLALEAGLECREAILLRIGEKFKNLQEGLESLQRRFKAENDKILGILSGLQKAIEGLEVEVEGLKN